MFRWVERLYTNYPRVKQVMSLFAVNMVIIPISVVSNIFITRYLPAVSYGDFKFLLYVFGLAGTLLNFGFLQAGNRAIVLTSDKQKSRELYGSMLIVTAVNFLVIAVAIAVYAYVDPNISGKGLKSVLLFMIPFSWIFLLMNYFETLFQADNKISLLAKSRLYPKIFFFVVTVAIYFIFREYSGNRLKLMLLIFLLTHVVGFLYILYKVNPSFRNFRERLREIWHFNKIYGFNVYIGTIFNVAMASLSGMLISYFGVNNAGVGYFALAMTISEPLNFIPNVIATTHYKEFSTKKKIERRLTMVTIGVSASALLLCWLLVGPFINTFYTEEYHPVILLTIIGSIGIMANGMGDYYNRFLGAHGQGKALRNSAMVVGVVIFACNFTLIPLFGETGAAYTRILSGVTYLGSMYWFYRRLSTRLTRESEEPAVEKNEAVSV